MTGRWHGRSASAGAALLIAAGAGSGAAVEKTFSVAITGAEGTRYTGRCTPRPRERGRSSSRASCPGMRRSRPRGSSARS
jgi:hypothetical protein